MRVEDFETMQPEQMVSTMQELYQTQVNMMTAIALARATLLQANAKGLTEAQRRAWIRKAAKGLTFPLPMIELTPIAIVKLKDDETHPVSAVCAIAGHCCYGQESKTKEDTSGHSSE